MLKNHKLELKKIETIFQNINSVIKEAKEFEELEINTRKEVFNLFIHCNT